MPVHVAADLDARKKVDVPNWSKMVGDYSDAQIAKAVTAAQKLPACPADPNMVQVVWPVSLTALAGAALDFGDAEIAKVRLGALFASQQHVELARLVWHIRHPGKRSDSAFIDMTGGLPFVAAPNNIIQDGHHALSALWLLGGSDLEVPVWMVPTGIASGH